MSRIEVVIWIALVGVIAWGSLVAVLAKFMPLAEAMLLGFAGTPR